MAYVVARPRDAWELRESRTTARGPRSRTLASFRAIDADVIAHAIERASAPLDEAAIRAAARRAGAPVAPSPADQAAAALLREVAHGHRPAPGLRRALLDALAGGGELSDSERAAAAWIGASPERRGRALWELLLLADHIPAPRRAAASGFPRLVSRGR